MINLLLVLFGLLLASCATKPAENHGPDVLFEDSHFEVRQVQSVDEIFFIDAEMEQFLAGTLIGDFRHYGKLVGLAKAFESKGPLKLYYAAEGTRNASFTFAQRKGNCLSLVIMAGAFAKHLGLHVRYYLVRTTESWGRQGDLLLGSQHVNLSIGYRFHDRISGDEGRRIIIDFLPPDDLKGQIKSEIDEKTVVAMYYNNNAAEHLVAGRLEEAYWSARAALLADSGFVPGINSLGVIYRRSGKFKSAEKAFQYALKFEPENASVLSNQERVLREQGETVRANSIATKLQLLEPYPPYYFFFKAMEALKRQELPKAKEAFMKELLREPYNHEIHFGLAATMATMGDIEDARRHLALAYEHSNTTQSRQMYSAKLKRLQSLGDQ